MKTFRSLVLGAIVGAFLGIILATLAAPRLLASQLCGITSDESTSRPCVATVLEATAGLIHTQEIGALLGAILGAGSAFAWVRRKPGAELRPPDPS
jgi:hypothetical protein